jgi:beta-lactamase class A
MKIFCSFIASLFLPSLVAFTQQGDPLRSKYEQRIKNIVNSADAIVGVAVKNLSTGEELLINGDEVFPQASSIKIHILAELYRQAATGRVKLGEPLPLPARSKVGGSGVLAELGDGTVSMSLRDYAILMIVLSDNTATNLIIETVGMENVNGFLFSHGVQQTKLQRIMMDMEAARLGRENIGTPREVMMILEKMYNGELVDTPSSQELISILKKPKGGSIRSGIPSSVELANKEGEIDGVRCDVGIVYLPKSPYVICVMTKMLATPRDGSLIITEISQATYRYFERKANSNRYGRRIAD